MELPCIKITLTQQNLLSEWISTQDQIASKIQKKEKPDYGYFSGYSWVISNSHLGTRIEVENIITKERIDITDYSEW